MTKGDRVWFWRHNDIMTKEEWHIFLTEKHRWTEHTKVRKIAAPPPTPPPKGRGVITEIPMLGGCRLLFASLSVSTIAETLCVLCMPKAFCVLETVRLKPPWPPCALWEKKLPSESQVFFLTWRERSISHREHRWTEHTGFHRDIKSTDFTEPYSHRSLTPLPHSFQEHALLHSRTCPLTSKNTPFLMLDKALLQRSLQPPDFM